MTPPPVKEGREKRLLLLAKRGKRWHRQIRYWRLLIYSQLGFLDPYDFHRALFGVQIDTAGSVVVGDVALHAAY